VFQVWNNIRIFIRGRYRTVDFIPLLLFSAWWKFHLLKWLGHRIWVVVKNEKLKWT